MTTQSIKTDMNEDMDTIAKNTVMQKLENKKNKSANREQNGKIKGKK